MPEIHLRLPAFTHSACAPFTKKTERMQNIKKTGDSKYFCQNKLDKACFENDIGYGDFKEEQVATDKLLGDKASTILLHWFITFSRKSLLVVVLLREGMSNRQITEELHIPISEKFETQKVYSSLKGADLADMQLISKLSNRISILRMHY